MVLELFSPEKQIKLMKYISHSNHRWRVFKGVHDKKCVTPMALSRIVGIHQPNVSKNLKELCDVGVVECANPSAYKGRLYRLTVNGELIYKYLTMSALDTYGEM